MKVIFPWIVLLALISPTFGQGIVNFNNISLAFPTDGIDRRVYDPRTCTPLVGTNFAAALYFGTAADSITQLAVRSEDDQTLLSAVGRFRIPTTANPGTWSGALRVLLGTTLGQSVILQIRIWDITLFETYADALAGGGMTLESARFSYTIPLSPSPTVSEISMLNLRAFGCIPEPSSILLMGLGAIGLIAFRRRR